MLARVRGPIQPSLEKISCINIPSRFSSKFAQHQSQFLLLKLLVVKSHSSDTQSSGPESWLKLTSPGSSKSLQYLCKANLKSSDDLQLRRLAE